MISTLTLGMIAPGAALAQASSDWVKPATSVVEGLQSGLVSVGGPLIGVGVVALGLFAAVSGRMEWHRAFYVVIGGILITVGPFIITTLLELANA